MKLSVLFGIVMASVAFALPSSSHLEGVEAEGLEVRQEVSLGRSCSLQNVSLLTLPRIACKSVLCSLLMG